MKWNKPQLDCIGLQLDCSELDCKWDALSWIANGMHWVGLQMGCSELNCNWDTASWIALDWNWKRLQQKQHNTTLERTKVSDAAFMFFFLALYNYVCMYA